MKNIIEKSNKNERTTVGAGLDSARDQRGITLIALILTVIVLLILAGVALNFVIGENGILKHAEFATNRYQNSSEKEITDFNTLSNQIDNFINNSNEQPKTLKYDPAKLDSKILLNNVTIDEDGIVTLDKSDSYVIINEAFLPQNNTWEIVTKFQFENSTASQAIIGKSGAHNPPYVATLKNGSNYNLVLDISSTDTSWNVASNVTGTKALNSNTWYWMKLKFDGTSYKVLISEDGINYQVDVNVSTAVVTYQQDEYVLGMNLWNNTQKLYGRYDLKETYIKIGNDYFFNGMSYFSYK